MSSYDNAYAAFLLDYAAGVLPPAERLVADLHRTLSPQGRVGAHLLEAAGGAMLEGLAPAPSGRFNAAALGARDDPRRTPSRLEPYVSGDLMALNWRRSIFGVKTAPTEVPMASFLRLDPGERAPAHGHGRRDVTVVLCGAYADAFGVYERGDLAFAEPGMKHEPRAVGDKTCVCLLATEAGRPLLGFFGLFGWGVRKLKEDA
jgi:anti-sigma factor ChrR (cupin superfamily)